MALLTSIHDPLPEKLVGPPNPNQLITTHMFSQFFMQIDSWLSDHASPRNMTPKDYMGGLLHKLPPPPIKEGPKGTPRRTTILLLSRSTIYCSYF